MFNIISIWKNVCVCVCLSVFSYVYGYWRIRACYFWRVRENYYSTEKNNAWLESYHQGLYWDLFQTSIRISKLKKATFYNEVLSVNNIILCVLKTSEYAPRGLNWPLRCSWWGGGSRLSPTFNCILKKNTIAPPSCNLKILFAISFGTHRPIDIQRSCYFYIMIL